MPPARGVAASSARSTLLVFIGLLLLAGTRLEFLTCGTSDHFEDDRLVDRHGAEATGRPAKRLAPTLSLAEAVHELLALQQHPNFDVETDLRCGDAGQARVFLSCFLAGPDAAVVRTRLDHHVNAVGAQERQEGIAVSP